MGDRGPLSMAPRWGREGAYRYRGANAALSPIWSLGAYRHLGVLRRTYMDASIYLLFILYVIQLMTGITYRIEKVDGWPYIYIGQRPI